MTSEYDGKQSMRSSQSDLPRWWSCIARSRWIKQGFTLIYSMRLAKASGLWHMPPC